MAAEKRGSEGEILLDLYENAKTGLFNTPDVLFKRAKAILDSITKQDVLLFLDEQKV